MGDVSKGSPERFGYSWERFRELTPEQELQFREWTNLLDPQTAWKGRRFLDAGCGAGRNSFWAMKYGADSGVAIDLDERSLEAALDNLRPYPRVTVRHGSIYDVPYEDEFDIAFSIGVVHHLDDPPAAVKQLAKAAKPGGNVLIWVYGSENLGVLLKVLDPLRIHLFSKLPLPVLRALAVPPALAVWLLAKSGISRLKYFDLLRGFTIRHVHHIVFDQMLPRTSNYFTEDEARSLLESAGLGNVRTRNVNDVSWCILGQKPMGA